MAKKKKNRGRYKKFCRWVAGVIAIMALVGALLLFTNRGKRLTEQFRELFVGAYMPSGEVYGIDVSHFQENIRWDKVGKIGYHPLTSRLSKNKGTSYKEIKFAIAKATEGSNGKYDDEYYEKNYQAIRKSGMKLGAYHVLTPGGKFEEQARQFIKKCKLQKGDIRPILDVEADISLKGDDLKKAVKMWIEIVEKYYGCKPIIYTSTVLYNKAFDNEEFGGYDFWIAQYYNPVLAVKAAIWQFTSRGEIDGINGKVDLNVLPNGEKTLEHLLIP
ncbi:MAG: glycoside hydrolase family 25 protein [Bacteroidales bacterium]|nr:glycoside hydrolase family 25 protein [Bacteroidales bacterium]